MTPEPIEAKFQLVDIEFQFPSDPHWYRTNVPVSGYATVMTSGLLNGKSISRVKLWTVTEDDMGQAHLIYDFEKAKAGIQAFEAHND
jgi:hypothetical protein